MRVEKPGARSIGRRQQTTIPEPRRWFEHVSAGTPEKDRLGWQAAFRSTALNDEFAQGAERERRAESGRP
jgi:hypothetical protein